MSSFFTYNIWKISLELLTQASDKVWGLVTHHYSLKYKAVVWNTVWLVFSILGVHRKQTTHICSNTQPYTWICRTRERVCLRWRFQEPKFLQSFSLKNTIYPSQAAGLCSVAGHSLAKSMQRPRLRDMWMMMPRGCTFSPVWLHPRDVRQLLRFTPVQW